MRIDAEENGLDIGFAVINAISADSEANQNKLIFKDYTAEEPSDVRTTFPLFQDTDDVNAWTLHDGGKDDIYVYDAEGNLSTYISSLGPNTNLSTDEGYQNLMSAILKAAGVL